MEDTSRPPLLSPDLPRFPGFCDGEDGNPEPDWSPPSSPLSCEDVHDMAPDGAFLTLEGFRAHSQLAHVAFQAARDEGKPHSPSCHEEEEQDDPALPLHNTVSDSSAEEAASDAESKHLEDEAEAFPADDVIVAALESAGPRRLPADVRPGTPAARAVDLALIRLGAASWTALFSEAAAERGCGAGTGGRSVTLAEALNPEHPRHHAAFAEAFRAARAGLAREAAPREAAGRGGGCGRGRGPPASGQDDAAPRSALTPADHAWYLATAARPLQGAEAARRAALDVRLAAERALYAGAVRAALARGTERYAHLTPRQAGQLEDDAVLRRRRVDRLPRLVRLALTVPAAGGGGGAAALRREHTLAPPVPCSALPAWTPPAPGAAVPGNRYYLPKVLAAGEGPGGRRGAAATAYRKPPCRWDRDPPDLPAPTPGCRSSWAGSALRAVLAGAGPWEIPLTVSGGDEGPHACFHKPLPRRGANARQRQQRLQRAAALSLGGADGARRAEAVAVFALGTHRLAVHSRAGLCVLGGAWAQAAGCSATAERGEQGDGAAEREADDRIGAERTVEEPAAVPASALPSPDPGSTSDPVPDHTSALSAAPSTSATPSPEPCRVVLGVRVEYLPSPAREAATLDELAWLAAGLALDPEARGALVAAVHVPTARFLGTQALTREALERAGGDALAARRHAALRTLEGLLAAMEGLAEAGEYLVTGGRGPVVIYAALAPELQEEGRDVEEGTRGAARLPLSGVGLPDPHTVYDVHAAHAAGAAVGAGDPMDDPAVAPLWQPADPGVPQIADTLPPKIVAGGRRGGPGRGARGRKRKLSQPYAWKVLGQGGDFDAVAGGTQISRAEYAAALGEEL
uniref:Uncharacterized protein n=1 Tax=Auxenochlorella protothecoides TaxID=3075 RepID=A0A1D2AF17_AUXPR